MDYCYLHYDNFNFVSTLDTSMYLLENVKNIESNMQGFESTTSSLLRNLSDKAYDPANKGFAVGSAKYSTSQKVYGLVQCWRDLSIMDCRSCLFQARQALKQCCSSKQGAHAMSGSCTVRYEIYPFFDSRDASSTSTPGTSPVVHSSEKSSKTLTIIMGLVGVMVFAFLICLIVMRTRLKSSLFGRPVTLAAHNKGRHGFSPESELLIQEQNFIFSLEALTAATENFHENKKLGEGDFGAVYKGRTRDGKEIAVKKLSAKSTQGKGEFMNEVKLLVNVQHRNLVKLLGCCAEGDERLLIYEYFPNKSLDSFLFDPEKRTQLDWQKRYNIILGIARGLLYLHEDSQMKITHKDIKARNILLDDKLNPKIADFAIARPFPEDKSPTQTIVAGTCGYMAPEYAMRGKLSVKADVYSFGVLLLEIVSGRKNTDINLAHEMQSLLEWTWRLYKEGNVVNMVDSTVLETCPREQALRCIHVGLLCVQANATSRPPMSNVIRMIYSNSATLPNPTKPGFVNIRNSHASKASSVIDENEKGAKSQTSGTRTPLLLQ